MSIMGSAVWLWRIEPCTSNSDKGFNVDEDSFGWYQSHATGTCCRWSISAISAVVPELDCNDVALLRTLMHGYMTCFGERLYALPAKNT
jgi:hypothetical protein